MIVYAVVDDALSPDLPLGVEFAGIRDDCQPEGPTPVESFQRDCGQLEVLIADRSRLRDGLIPVIALGDECACRNPEVREPLHNAERY